MAFSLRKLPNPPGNPPVFKPNYPCPLLEEGQWISLGKRSCLAEGWLSAIGRSPNWALSPFLDLLPASIFLPSEGFYPSTARIQTSEMLANLPKESLYYTSDFLQINRQRFFFDIWPGELAEMKSDRSGNFWERSLDFFILLW